MSAVVAVLVVVPENDPGGLLAAGACGAEPPIVRLCPSLRVNETHWRWVVGRTQHANEQALVLWWEGRCVSEGWDRFRRCALPLSPWEPTLEDVRMLAETAVRSCLVARVVCLDSAGQEVPL